ncbi:putative Rhodanese-like domain, calcium sensing receptor, plant [Helianthus annuus]|nr:putative Rhodanese-like domain, calcium sensing receptor, plant [Helianthus annuus]KAJ0778743.1 putative Rhodanese-like domain, calcium sensing receptor, plant [Helianthus annuus]
MLPVSSTIANQVCLYGGSYLHHKVKCVMENDVVSFKTPTPFNLQNTFLATNIPDAYSLKPADDVFGGINDTLSALVCNTDTAITNTLNSINTSLKLASKGVNDALDVSLDKLKVSLSSALSGLGNNSKGVSSKVGVVAVDGLRQAIIAVEGVLAQGVTLVAYGYGYVKDTLPPEVQNVLNASEENVFRPVGTAFQQIYVVLEGFEASIGIDPSDPIVPVVLLLATSTTLWVSYWVLTYAGYAGDLSPQLTLELLNGKENDFREKDGIPDLRRKARFRYASVSFPEVDANVKKLLKGGKDLDDALVSTVIRNLKVVQGGSKVIVMDADGSRSKGIARALRKFGIKASICLYNQFCSFTHTTWLLAWPSFRPYLVQGGFRSWVQEGLRIKEPKPETTLTILNEEAEAILEDVTPLQVIGYGVGFLAAAYALLEWETTLQLIAIFGVGQTIYKRVASYEDSKDFNRDVRQLLAPVKLGGQAISWAAGKLETNRNGLPTSPSSVNVQNRVLQAAAKHESQPDSEEPTSSVNQTPPDLSEA